MATMTSNPSSQRESFRFDLTVERTNARDALRVILHSILFQRSFGSVRPRSIDLLDLTFVS